MIMAYMEVQCFEMWGKVKIEKLQNDPSLVSHSIFFRVNERVFPMFLWLLCILTLNINMYSNKRVHKQTNNKQTNMCGHLKEDSNHLISQNHINHNKDTNDVAGGLICMDFYAHCQGSLISSMFIDFNNMIRAQYRVDDPSAFITTPCLMLLMS